MRLLLLAAVFIPAGLLVLRSLAQDQQLAHARTFRLRFPRELKHEAVITFIRTLSGLKRPWWKSWLGVIPVAFEVRSEGGAIFHRLTCPAGVREFVLAELRGAIPGIRLEEDRSSRAFGASLAGELRLAGGRASLRTENSEAISLAILSALSAKETESALVQFVVAPTAPRLPFGDLLRAALHGSQAREPEPKAVREKTSEPLYLVAIRLGVKASGKSRARQLLSRLTAVWHMTSTTETSFRRRLTPNVLSSRAIHSTRVPLLSFPSVLNAKELASVIAFPTESALVPGLVLGGCRQLAPSPQIPATGLVVARSNFPGVDRNLAIKEADARRHVYLVGPTGAGKSTVLDNLIIGIMERGRGLILIDPKGDLASDVLAHIPIGREGDVIVIDPTDDECAPGLNLLEVAGRDRELMTEQVVGIFYRIYKDSWGPRTDDILRSAVLTLSHLPGMTLCEIPLLLTHESFRRKLVGKIDDPFLEQFWGSYEAWSKGERNTAIAPVQNKLRAVLLRRRLRAIIGQSRSTIDLEKILEEGKCLIVSTPKGLLGDDASSLLGSLVLARLWQVAQRRASLPKERRTTFFVLLDEFQDFLNLPSSIEGILTQARAFGLSLVLAHQHLGQLPADLRQAVLANTRTKIVFQTAAQDARVLSREFAPHLTADDLMGLGPYEIVLSASVDGAVAPPATGITLPPVPPKGNADEVRALSRKTYGRSITEVEAEIRRRQQPGAPDAPIGERRAR